MLFIVLLFYVVCCALLVLFILYPMLPVNLDCQFLTAPSGYLDGFFFNITPLDVTPVFIDVYIRQ